MISIRSKYHLENVFSARCSHVFYFQPAKARCPHLSILLLVSPGIFKIMDRRHIKCKMLNINTWLFKWWWRAKFCQAKTKAWYDMRTCRTLYVRSDVMLRHLLYLTCVVFEPVKVRLVCDMIFNSSRNYCPLTVLMNFVLHSVAHQ